MAEAHTQRRLAAILAADVVGYARLIRADEEGTLDRLKVLRAELVDPTIARHHGRIVKLMGDGMLAEFASVVDAVRAAIEFQQAMVERDGHRDAGDAIAFRVGINLGDVVIDGEDIQGDGVNVAARLEGLAEPGGICISGGVYEQVRDRIDLPFEDLGDRAVKNIDRPIRVWRWPVGRSAAAPEAAPAASAPRPAEKPSIAVLPFENMSGDPDQEYFADGLAEDIITALSKVSNLTVIARNSTFAYKSQATDPRQIGRDLGVRYVLEGSTRRSGERLRITAQLIDTAGADHVWAERYDRLVEDIFDLQDDITREIVTALRVQLTDGEIAAVWNRGTENIEAWRLVIQAADMAFRFTAADTLKTRELAERATRVDPNYGSAWALLGFTFFSEARIMAVEDMETLVARAETCASKASAIDITNPLTIGLNVVLRMLRGRFDQAIALARQGLEHNPGSADVRAFLGFALSLAGHASEARRFLDDAMRLNPLHPVWYFPAIARAFDADGDRPRARDALRQALARQPDNFPSLLHLASLLGRDGEIEDARQAANGVLRLAPNFSVSQADRYLLTPLQDFAIAFKDGLRQAGLPE